MLAGHLKGVFSQTFCLLLTWGAFLAYGQLRRTKSWLVFGELRRGQQGAQFLGRHEQMRGRVDFLNESKRIAMMYTKSRKVYARDCDTNGNPANPYGNVKHVALESHLLNDIDQLQALDIRASIDPRVCAYNCHIASGLCPVLERSEPLCLWKCYLSFIFDGLKALTLSILRSWACQGLTIPPITAPGESPTRGSSLNRSSTLSRKGHGWNGPRLRGYERLTDTP
jgi:hypothetical protein